MYDHIFYVIQGCYKDAEDWLIENYILLAMVAIVVGALQVCLFYLHGYMPHNMFKNVLKIMIKSLFTFILEYLSNFT